MVELVQCCLLLQVILLYDVIAICKRQSINSSSFCILHLRGQLLEHTLLMSQKSIHHLYCSLFKGIKLCVMSMNLSMERSMCQRLNFQSNDLLKV